MDMQTSPADERLAIAEAAVLTANDLSREDVARVLSGMVGSAAEFGDLYFQSSHGEAWRMEDQKISNGGFSLSQGVGVRTVAGEQAAFAHSSEISPTSIRLAADAVRDMRKRGVDATRVGGVRLAPTPSPHALYPTADPIDSLEVPAKLELLREVDRKARAADPRIIHVVAALDATRKIVLIADSDGRLAADVRPQVTLALEVVAEQAGKRVSGAAHLGGRYPLNEIDQARLDQVVARAVHIALTNLEARPAPAGVMPVVLGPGVPGILLHEAVGHGLEADAHRKRSSVFSDNMGLRIAARGVTVIDDGSLAGRRGSMNVDDEGVPTERTVLIEDGRLTGMLQDRLNAALMNGRPTGNGRRQSYAHLPLPRMTNTFLAAGEHDPAEIVASVKNGIYAVEFGGGTVDITSGQFNFSATEAYLIEDGRITAPIQGATLIGLGHQALSRIGMIGNDLAIDNGVCGKAGQNVQVGVGQPTVRIDEMVVGGTA